MMRVRRLLPRGPIDLIVQLALLALAYWAWRHARGAAAGGIGISFAHARDLIGAERSLGLLIEPRIQHWAVGAGWPVDIASWGYANLHFKGSCLMLAILYLGYRPSYGFVRNAVFAAMAISIAAYAFFPTAPPRFLPELGLDPSSAVTGNTPYLSHPGDSLFNPFAAMPSMHVCFSVILAWSLATQVRNRLAAGLLFAYPLLMTYIVVVSGNHFVLDVLLGLVTAAISVGVAALLARVNPDWAFRRPAPEPETETELPAQAQPEAAPA